MDFKGLEILASIAFLLVINGLLWIKFCKRLNYYALKIGRNSTVSIIISYSPLVIFPSIIGLIAFMVERFFVNNEALYFIVLIVSFFLIFGSYLILLFWYGGIKTSEQVEQLNK